MLIAVLYYGERTSRNTRHRQQPTAYIRNRVRFSMLQIARSPSPRARQHQTACRVRRSAELRCPGSETKPLITLTNWDGWQWVLPRPTGTMSSPAWIVTERTVLT